MNQMWCGNPKPHETHKWGRYGQHICAVTAAKLVTRHGKP